MTATCRSCGLSERGKLRFFAAFPEHDGDRAAFSTTERPLVSVWRMLECKGCGAVSPAPYPSESEIASYYREAALPNDWEVSHYVRLDRNPAAMRGIRRTAEQITRLNGGPGRLLEVGCAAGWLLAAARDCGWQVQGIEAAPKFSRFARSELGLDVYEGTVASFLPKASDRFDVIVMLDVFEHLYDPISDLKALRRVAAPEAELLLTTPNIASRVARAWGLKWRQIVPSHITYSTPRSIEFALPRSGWRLERISEPRYWDPLRARELTQRSQREIGKFGVRLALYATLVRWAGRTDRVKQLVDAVMLGKWSWEDVIYRVGDQPVLGDVMLVVAKPQPTG